MSDAESNVGEESDVSVLIEEGSAGSLSDYDYVEDAEALGNDEFYWDETINNYVYNGSNDQGGDPLHLSDLSQSNMDDSLHLSDLSHSNVDDSLHMSDLISESKQNAPTPGTGSLPVNRGRLDEAPSPSSGSLGLESLAASVGNLSVLEEGVESEFDPEDLDTTGVSLNDSSGNGVDDNVNKRLFEESQAQLEDSQTSEYMLSGPLLTPEGSDFDEGLEDSFASLNLSAIRRSDEEYSEDEMDDTGEFDKSSNKSELHKIRLRF